MRAILFTNLGFIITVMTLLGKSIWGKSIW
jgi:hypothetical protein